MAIKINTEINLSVVVSVITGIITLVAFIVSIKGDIKTLTTIQKSDMVSTNKTIDEISVELGEIRRLHLQAAMKTIKLEKDTQKATLLAINNTKKINATNDIVTKVAAVVSIPTTEEVKKKNP